MNSYFAFESVIGRITRLLSGFCLMVVFTLFLLNILTRVPFINWNPTWIDEVIQFFLVWMIFLSAAELVRTGEHFVVDYLTDKVKGTGTGRAFRLISTAVMLVTYAFIFFFGIKLCMRSSVKATFTLPYFVKMSWFYSCIPVCAFFMLIYALRDFIFAIADIVTGGRIEVMLKSRRESLKENDEDNQIIKKAADTLANKGGGAK
ncbi:MAG: TRAP transporter small permease subunit [Succinatimonas hippei]|nr:TRAP transporter small permease subunit [Succinatimonas hippei]